MTTTDEAWDAGYAKGYSQGYANSVHDLIGWLLDAEHQDAAAALRYALSPEGVAEQNARIKELQAVPRPRRCAVPPVRPDVACPDRRPISDMTTHTICLACQRGDHRFCDGDSGPRQPNCPCDGGCKILAPMSPQAREAILILIDASNDQPRYDHPDY